MNSRDMDENDALFRTMPRLTLSPQDKAKMLSALKNVEASTKVRRYPLLRKSSALTAATVAFAGVASVFVMTKLHARTPEAPVLSKTTGAAPLKNPIAIETYQGKTFKANILLVRDPKRIEVGVTKYIGKVGETVSSMVQDAGAVAGVNGGTFKNIGDKGTGGSPLGITIHNGRTVTNYPTAQPEVGFTTNGKLISGNFTVAQLKALDVTEAVAFGPTLVSQGKGMVKGNGGWGYAPRTAIGQRADGTVIFIVTDGRFRDGVDNLGASLKDLEELMLNYGAVTAANLDGGSSSTMVYQGRLLNRPADIFGERKVATVFLVLGK